MFEDLDDPNPPRASLAHRDDVARRAAGLRRARQRQQRVLLSVAALIPLAAVALVVALVRRGDDTGVSTDTSTSSSLSTTSTAQLPSTSTPSSSLTTTPGTATTLPAAPLAMRSVSDIDATTASSVWAVGPSTVNDCQGDPCVAVAHSTDGGRTWDAVGPPPGVDALNVTHIRFGSATDGYLYGPELWVTHNAGQTWSQEATEPAVNVLGVEPEQADVWMVATTCKQGLRCPLLVYASSDAGRTWPAQPTAQVGIDGATASVVREADAHAWISAVSPDGVASAALATTSDNGKTWRTLTVPCTTDPTMVADIAVVDPQHLWFACGSDFATIQEQKQVFLSSDGGKTWAPMADPGLFAHLSTISAPSATRVFMALERGGLTSVAPGDSMWRDDIDVTKVCDGGFSRVLFVDPHHGWAASATTDCQHAVVWRTDDAGATWQPVQLG